MPAIHGIPQFDSWPVESNYRKVGIIVKKNVCGKRLAVHQQRVIVLLDTATCLDKIKFRIKQIFGVIKTDKKYIESFKNRKLTKEAPEKSQNIPRPLSAAENPPAHQSVVLPEAPENDIPPSSPEHEEQIPLPLAPKEPIKPVRLTFPFSFSTLRAGEVRGLLPSYFAVEEIVDPLTRVTTKLDECAYLNTVREDFLNTRLCNWPYLSENTIGRFCTMRPEQYPEKVAALDKLILERIKFLNSTVGFEARLEKVKDSPHLNEIRIKDLFAPWQESVLRIALSTDKDLGRCTLLTLNSLNADQMSMLRARRMNIPKRAELINEVVCLSDLFNLEYPTEHLEKLPPKALALLTSNQINKITTYPKGMTQHIFNPNEPDTREKIQSLKVETLNEFAVSGEFNKKQWEVVSTDQIKNAKSTFWKNPIVFDFLFPKLDDFHHHAVGHARMNSKNLEVLSKEQINQNLYLFDGRRLQLLQDSQFKEINWYSFKSIDMKQKFLEMLPIDTDNAMNDTNRRVQLIPSNDLKYCVQHLTATHVSYLSKEQLQSWDFHGYPLTEEQFEALFPSNWNDFEMYEKYKRLAPSFFNEDMISSCKKLMTGKRLMLISDEVLTNMKYYRYEKKADCRDL